MRRVGRPGNLRKSAQPHAGPGGIRRAPTRLCRLEKVRSRPVSRVLSRAVIHLGPASPRASSNLPGSPGGRRCGQAACSPIWSCSGWGLPCRGMLPPARCALTAPFHPYRPATGWRFVFCGTFRGLAPPRRYLAPCLAGARTFLPPWARSPGPATAWPTPRRTLRVQRWSGNFASA